MTDEGRAAEIKKWQDGLFDAFWHNGVLGDRYFGPVIDMEPLIGGVFVEKYYGHRVLIDSFMDFFGETLSKQGEFNSTKGWPQDPDSIWTSKRSMFTQLLTHLRQSSAGRWTGRFTSTIIWRPAELGRHYGRRGLAAESWPRKIRGGIPRQRD